MKTALLAAACMIALPACALAQDGDWRALDPENTLVLEIASADAPDTTKGVVVIELAREFAPRHIDQITQLVKQRFYDGRQFQRVISDFMAQGGGLPGQPEGGNSPLPNIEAEFRARLGPDRVATKVQDARTAPRGAGAATTEAGYLDGFAVAYQPAAQAMVSVDGKRDVWGLHCPGAVAAARTSNPNSANFQFYITRGEADWLDGSYTIFGAVRQGQDAVMALKSGEPVINPDLIRTLRVAADLPEDERPNLEVMRTDSEAFRTLVEEARLTAGGNINVCNVTVPVREAQ